METLTISLPDRTATRVRKTAERLGLSPEDLVRSSIESTLRELDTDFEAAADHVLAKNAELYRRLA